MALVVKNLPANAGDLRDTGPITGSGRSPGGDGMATHSVFLPRESHQQESGRLLSIGWQRVKQDWVNLAATTIKHFVNDGIFLCIFLSYTNRLWYSVKIPLYAQRNEKNCDLLYHYTGFIGVIWNQTLNSSEVCLYFAVAISNIFFGGLNNIYICVYIYVHTYMYMYVYIHICISIYIHTHTYIWKFPYPVIHC